MDGNAYNLYFYTDVPNPGLVFDTTNLINGKPVRYYENKGNFAVDGAELPGATYIFVDCHNVSLSGTVGIGHVLRGIIPVLRQYPHDPL